MGAHCLKLYESVGGLFELFGSFILREIVDFCDTLYNGIYSK